MALRSVTLKGGGVLNGLPHDARALFNFFLRNWCYHCFFENDEGV